MNRLIVPTLWLALTALPAGADNLSSGDAIGGGGGHVPGGVPFSNMDRTNAGPDGGGDSGALSRDRIPSRDSLSRPDLEDREHQKDERYGSGDQGRKNSSKNRTTRANSVFNQGPDSSL